VPAPLPAHQRASATASFLGRPVLLGPMFLLSVAPCYRTAWRRSFTPSCRMSARRCARWTSPTRVSATARNKSDCPIGQRAAGNACRPSSCVHDVLHAVAWYLRFRAPFRASLIRQRSFPASPLASPGLSLSNLVLCSSLQMAWRQGGSGLRATRVGGWRTRWPACRGCGPAVGSQQTSLTSGEFWRRSSQTVTQLARLPACAPDEPLWETRRVSRGRREESSGVGLRTGPRLE
jgi:hypothetical protein